MADIEAKLSQVTLEATVYTSEKTGSDETGTGTKEKPYKTALKGLKTLDLEKPFACYVDAKQEDAAEKFELISKTKLKDLKKYIETEARKESKQSAREVSMI